LHGLAQWGLTILFISGDESSFSRYIFAGGTAPVAPNRRYTLCRISTALNNHHPEAARLPRFAPLIAKNLGICGETQNEKARRDVWAWFDFCLSSYLALNRAIIHLLLIVVYLQYENNSS